MVMPRASRSTRWHWAALAAAALGTGAHAQSDTDARRDAVARVHKAAYSQQKLAALFPPDIADWKRTRLGNPVPDSDHEVSPVMQAQYRRGNEVVDIEVLDLGKAGVLAAKQASAVPLETRQTATGTERTYLSHGHLVREAVDTAEGRTSAGVVLRNGLNLRLVGRGADAQALQQLIDAIDLDRAAKLRHDSH